MVGDARLYDTIQVLAGAGEVRRRIEACLPRLVTARALVVDVGAGTGTLRRILPTSVVHICLDLDPAKLRRAILKDPAANALLADATKAPLASGCADAVVCVAVSHHLTDQQLDRALDEIGRLLKDEGIFLFLDAIWMPKRLLSRMLWRFDRGSNPRGPELLLAQLTRRFSTTHCERFGIYHEYLLYVGNKKRAGTKPDA
jgi:SAM-dependent methyltransferase